MKAAPPESPLERVHSLHQSALIEGCVKEVPVSLILKRIAKRIFSPALHAVRWSPEPAQQLITERIGSASLRPATDIDRALTNLVLTGIQRCEDWESLRNLPDHQIALGIVKTPKHGVVHILQGEGRPAGLANVRS